MNPGDPIIIERVGNGFLVSLRSHDWSTRSRDELLVFQHLGEAIGSQKDPSALLNFLEQHFSSSDAP